MNEPTDDERLLERLALWLRETRAELERPDPATPDPAENGEQAPREFGLLQLVEEFTALRHELKLQTKSARGLEEQNESLTASLRQAIEALRSVEPQEAQAAWSAGKPLALALADLDESLERGRLQTERALERLGDEPELGALSRLRELYSRRSWWSRWRHGRFFESLCEQLAREPQRHDLRALATALLEGYRLVQKRLSQALVSEGIERIDAVGQPVDPEQMVVIDMVEVDGGAPGLVYDEVRRGYLWKGRLLRYAEVRATRLSLL